MPYFKTFFPRITRLVKEIEISTSPMGIHEKDSPRSQHIDTFSKLFSASVSEFFHQINLDGNELLTRPDTIS